MKNRVKGLLALCLAMCMVLAMTTVAFGAERIFGAISDSEWTQLNVGDTVKAQNSSGCGMPFYVVDGSGNYLTAANTSTYGANGQAYSSESESLESPPDRSYFGFKYESNGIVYDTFTLPAVKDLFGDSYAAGYHYEAKAINGISESNDNDDAAATAATANTTIDKVYGGNGSDRYPITNALMLKAVENSNYKVEYDLNGGTAADGTNSIAAKTNVKWTDKVLDGVTTPTKDGHVFVGWEYKESSLAINATTAYKDLAGSDSVMSITLTAVWEVLPDDETPTTPTPTHQHTRRQPATTTVETPSTTVASPKTFDAGVAVYGVMAALSLTGTAAIIDKKKKF